MDNLSKNIDETINNLKNIFEKINEDKEKLKLEIQSVFTKLRNIIYEGEDQLLLDVDKKFNELFFKEELIKEGEKLPNKIKISLENGKKIVKEWDDNKLNFLINDSLNIENNIKDINHIEKTMQKSNLNDSSKIKFAHSNEEFNQLLDLLKKFGNIIYISIPSEILNNNFDSKQLILGWLPKKTE